MAHPGTLHTYTSKLVAFEHGPNTTATNTLLWIGGLTDGLLTVQYPAKLASSLLSSWRVVEVLLSSSYDGWGTGTLERDAQEISKAVAYFKNLDSSGKGKIVLMGHSTGCQDIMQYLVGPHKDDSTEPRPSIDGSILQGGVSDREAWLGMVSAQPASLESFNSIVEEAKKMVDAGKGNECMSRAPNPVTEIFEGPITAYRMHSILSEGGDDDYFSSYLSDERLSATFGKIPKETPMCFMVGSQDPYWAPTVGTKEELFQRWAGAVKAGGGICDEVNGGFIEGAKHNLNGQSEEVVGHLVDKVKGFVGNVENGFPGTARL